MRNTINCCHTLIPHCTTDAFPSILLAHLACSPHSPPSVFILLAFIPPPPPPTSCCLVTPFQFLSFCFHSPHLLLPPLAWSPLPFSFFLLSFSPPPLLLLPFFLRVDGRVLEPCAHHGKHERLGNAVLDKRLHVETRQRFGTAHVTAHQHSHKLEQCRKT